MLDQDNLNLSLSILITCFLDNLWILLVGVTNYTYGSKKVNPDGWFSGKPGRA